MKQRLKQTTRDSTQDLLAQTLDSRLVDVLDGHAEGLDGVVQNVVGVLLQEWA